MVGLPRDDDGQLTAYVWPGGYPLYYYDIEHNVLCVTCARESDQNELELPEYQPIGHGINYEDDELYCQTCNKQIEAAYK